MKILMVILIVTNGVLSKETKTFELRLLCEIERNQRIIKFNKSDLYDTSSIDIDCKNEAINENRTITSN